MSAEHLQVFTLRDALWALSTEALIHTAKRDDHATNISSNFTMCWTLLYWLAITRPHSLKRNTAGMDCADHKCDKGR